MNNNRKEEDHDQDNPALSTVIERNIRTIGRYESKWMRLKRYLLN